MISRFVMIHLKLPKPLMEAFNCPKYLNAAKLKNRDHKTCVKPSKTYVYVTKTEIHVSKFMYLVGAKNV